MTHSTMEPPTNPRKRSVSPSEPLGLCNKRPKRYKSSSEEAMAPWNPHKQPTPPSTTNASPSTGPALEPSAKKQRLDNSAERASKPLALTSILTPPSTARPQLEEQTMSLKLLIPCHIP